MNVIVIAPHPDDDAIGCGGTIRKHIVSGDKVHVVYVTSGEKGIPDTSPEQTKLIREEEAGVCSQILQTHELVFLHEEDGRINASHLMQKLKTYFDVCGPELVYVTNANESHEDHRHCWGVVWQLCKQRNIILREYEVWTPLHAVNVNIDITEYASLKRSAIRAYKSQDTRNSFSEGILALNHYRGIMHGPNKMYVESFLERNWS